MFLIYKITSAISKRIKAIGAYWHNYFLLKNINISCTSPPKIRGKLHVCNKGKMILGKEVIFNCSRESNWVGLYKPCTISVRENAFLYIGNYSGFSGVSIYCQTEIKIGENVNCGGNVCIWDTDFHPLEYKDRRIHNVAAIKSAAIVIGDDVFIGANSIILKGVVIGTRSIIGAGSVVTKEIPADEIWAGNPARFIRKIQTNA